MKCKYCSCTVHKHGKTNNGRQRYRCSNWLHCGKTFTDIEYKKVFIIACPECKKEVVGFRYGRVCYFDKKGNRKHRYRCSVCGITTVKIQSVEEGEK